MSEPEMRCLLSKEEVEQGRGVLMSCSHCTRLFLLYYNGGELDTFTCCGNRYTLEATGYTVVKSRGV